MADDWHCKQIPNGSNPLVVCEREALQAEIERLRAALAIASGMISTLPQYEHQHPESIMEMLLVEARRG